MSIPKHERAPSRLDAQHMARKISMEITTELARTFGYSKAKFEKRIETMTKYLPPGPDREQAAAQIREQEQGFNLWLIEQERRRMHDLSREIPLHLRAANSIWPSCQMELGARRLELDKAIAACWKLQEGSNEGYILFSDFSGYYANILHQISTNTGVFLPVPIDNYAKIVRGIKEAARYSDDFYMIARTKEELHEAMAGVRREAEQLGLIINEKKTHICKLGGQYRHLQMLYSLHPDGEITCKINPKAITRERRKLKAYKRLVDDGRMEYREVENNFKSWICANYKFMSKQQIRNMIALFRELFGKDITWKKKKGHGRLRWLMGQSSKS